MSTPNESEKGLTPTPKPEESGAGQQPSSQGEAIKPSEGELIRGTIASGEDPLVRAVEIAAYQGPMGDRNSFPVIQAAINRHFSQEAQQAKAENRHLQEKLSVAQDKCADLREQNAGLRAQIDAFEKPWVERARNVVGGGLMGVSFTVFGYHPGAGIFVFILGLGLVAVSLIPWRGGSKNVPPR